MKIDDETFYALVEEQLADGGRVKINIGGKSMLPTLSGKDTILLEPLKEEPREGDILFFREGGRHIIHRLIRREGDIYILQGDNNIGTERVKRDAMLGRLVKVIRADGTVIDTDSEAWGRVSHRAERHKKRKQLANRWLGPQGRQQLRPWYFIGLAFLMWAPLNGVGIPLNNYVLGLRMDHLFHASVFIPCAVFFYDLYKKKGIKVWLSAVAVGVLTESVQYLLPYRGFDINDMVANFLGVTLGWAAILLKKTQNKFGRSK